MNILENLYVVKSASDIVFLKFGLFISLAFAIPFLALLFGSAVFSIIHLNKAKQYNSTEYLDFSKFLSGIATKIWFRMLFGILPVFGSVFFFTQLYANKLPGSSSNLFMAFIFFMIGLCSIVFYRGSFRKKNIEEIGNIFSTKLGWIGVTFILIAAYIFVAYFPVTVANNNIGFLEILFSPSVILYLLLFSSLSFGLTAAVVVAMLNRSSIKDYTDYGRNFSSQTGMIFSFLHPLLLVLLVFNVPHSGLSFAYFIAVTIVLILMLVTAIQFYYSYKESNTTSTSIVFVFILLFSVLIYSVQTTAETANKKEIIEKAEVEVFS